MSKLFLKPGEVSSRNQYQEQSSSRLFDIGESSYDYESTIAASLLTRNTPLPIHNYKEALLYAVKEYRTVVVVGETGSGKTTQIPQFLFKVCLVSSYEMFLKGFLGWLDRWRQRHSMYAASSNSHNYSCSKSCRRVRI